jgi:hypothetical protein
MSTDQDFEIELDFTRVQNSAERVRTMLHELRRRFDLTPFEFCTKVRIAPTEIPHSHPRIILNRQSGHSRSTARSRRPLDHIVDGRRRSQPALSELRPEDRALCCL